MKDSALNLVAKKYWHDGINLAVANITTTSPASTVDLVSQDHAQGGPFDMGSSWCAAKPLFQNVVPTNIKNAG